MLSGSFELLMRDTILNLRDVIQSPSLHLSLTLLTSK